MFFNGKAQSKCVGEFEYCLFSDLHILTSMAEFLSAMGNTKKLISSRNENSQIHVEQALLMLG